MPDDEDQLRYEETYVHQVYDEIASHFSSTRFKPWPVVDEFLKSLPVGATGLDIGCGNGKYLTVRRDIFMVASDRSPELLKFALQHQPHSAVVGDILNLPHQNGQFDFAICIAVVHHLSTPQRRQDGIRAILRTLRSTKSNIRSSMRPGQALVFVWALEQKNSRRGWDAGMDQDVLVPWVLKTEHDKSRSRHQAVTRSTAPSDSPDSSKQFQPSNNENTSSTSSASPQQPEERTFNRYYHLYREGELENDIVAAGGKVVKSGYDRDNWWAIFERGTQFDGAE